MTEYESSYLSIARELIDTGALRKDRTGVGTRALFCKELVHDWAEGFPVMRHRAYNPVAAFGEMVCFMRGFTHIDEFIKRKCNWWQANLDDFNKRNECPNNKDLGPIYGYKWRNFHGFDQLLWLIGEAERNPHSRRLLVTAWDPSDQKRAVLPPCHYSWQIFINGAELDLEFNMRSVDWMLGCPADMAAYGFLQLALCRQLGKVPGRLIGKFADTHIYLSHMRAAEEMLDSLPVALPGKDPLQYYSWAENAPTNMFQIEPHHLELHPGMLQGPRVKFEMAV
jgi:thymidylate synthase